MKKVLIASLLFTGLFFIGCKKQTPTTSQQPQAVSESAPSALAAAETEQKTCPVMGGEIDKNIFVEYQGQKVYFCCKQCVADFQKEPEKYLPKLPQFKE